MSDIEVHFVKMEGPELGNMLFGHSRGEFTFPRLDVFEEKWQEVCDAWGLDWYGYPEAAGIDEVDNDLFAVRSYWWGDEDAAEAEMPNFLHKPSGFEIRWYKYPFRDSYSNQEPIVAKVLALFDECIQFREAQP